MMLEKVELKEREKEIVKYRVQGLSFREIREIYDISARRASQIFRNAQRKIGEIERRLLVSSRN